MPIMCCEQSPRISDQPKAIHHQTLNMATPAPVGVAILLHTFIISFVGRLYSDDKLKYRAVGPPRGHCSSRTVQNDQVGKG